MAYPSMGTNRVDDGDVNLQERENEERDLLHGAPPATMESIFRLLAYPTISHLPMSLKTLGVPYLFKNKGFNRVPIP